MKRPILTPEQAKGMGYLGFYIQGSYLAIHLSEGVLLFGIDRVSGYDPGDEVIEFIEPENGAPLMANTLYDLGVIDGDDFKGLKRREDDLLKEMTETIERRQLEALKAKYES